MATAAVLLRSALNLRLERGGVIEQEACDRLVTALVVLGDWRAAWQICKAHPDGTGSAYGRLLVATGAGILDDLSLDALADRCLTLNRFVLDLVTSKAVPDEAARITDPGSRSAAAAYAMRSSAAWARLPQAVERLRRSREQRTRPAHDPEALGSHALMGMPVREVLAALRASPTVMASVREDTQLGEMQLGDWMGNSAESRQSASSAAIVRALGPETASSVLSGLRDLVTWAETQNGEGPIVLSRYLTYRTATRKRRMML